MSRTRGRHLVRVDDETRELLDLVKNSSLLSRTYNQVLLEALVAHARDLGVALPAKIERLTRGLPRRAHLTQDRPRKHPRRKSRATPSPTVLPIAAARGGGVPVGPPTPIAAAGQ